MNRTFAITRFARSVNNNSRLLMEFSDHESITGCQRCNASVKGYFYIPVLNNMYVCPMCYSQFKWWGLALLKEMINVE